MTTEEETEFVPSLAQRAEMALEDCKMVLNDIKQVSEAVDKVCTIWKLMTSGEDAERTSSTRWTLDEMQYALTQALTDLAVLNDEILQARS